jgi:hypothetical protein
VSLPRSILTRLHEAVWRETIACYARSELGLVEKYGGPDAWKIFPIHLLPKQSVVGPRQINVVPVSPEWRPGVGGISDTEKQVALDYHFPVNEVFQFTPGGNTFHDEIDALKSWLAGGGSVENKNGRLLDPDAPTGAIGADRFININLTSFHVGDPTLYPNATSVASALVSVLVTFGTRENSQGERK